MTSPARAGKSLLAAVTVVGMAAWLWQPIRYANDLWWHLAVGRYIVQHHTIPLHDVFSWTVQGRRWINHEWLFQVFLYACYSVLGMNGLILQKTVLILAALAVQWRRLQRRGVGWFYQWVIVAAMFWMSRYGWNERADLVSLLFLSLLVYALDTADEAGEITTPMAAAPFAFLLWANSHGGFVLGGAVAAVWSAGAWIENRIPRKPLALWLGLCAAATLINPNFYHLHLSTLEGLRLLRQGFFTEWQRTPWSPLEGFWFSLAVFWLFLAAFVWRQKKIPWGAAFVSALLSYGAVGHVRNVPFFMVGAFGYLAVWLHELADGRRLERRIESHRGAWLTLSLLLTGLFAAHAVGRMHGGVRKDMFPIEACEFIKDQEIPGLFYNEDGFGGYWMWTFGTRRPVFIDGRFHTVDGYIELYREVHKAQESRPEVWQNLLNRYGIDGALLSYPEPLLLPAVFRLYFPPKNWALVYWDDVALIFVRRTPALSGWIQAHEFKVVDPEGSLQHFQQQMRSGSPESKELWNELQRNLKLHPDSQRTRRLLAVALSLRMS